MRLLFLVLLPFLSEGISFSPLNRPPASAPLAEPRKPLPKEKGTAAPAPPAPPRPKPTNVQPTFRRRPDPPSPILPPTLLKAPTSPPSRLGRPLPKIPQNPKTTPPDPAVSEPYLDRTSFTVVGHRGDSGTFPEHTLEAYRAAVEQGADFIECDVVMTSDSCLICRHDATLDNTTDIASRQGLIRDLDKRRKTRLVDGKEVTGYFTVDFTLEEIKSLRAVQRFPYRSQAQNGLHPVVTFEEFLKFAKDPGHRVVGVYPEIKHPSFFNGILAERAGGEGGRARRIEDMFLEAIEAAGYPLGSPLEDPKWSQSPVIIQCFEAASLAYLRPLTRLPLMLLLPAFEPQGSDFNKWILSDAGMSDYSHRTIQALGFDKKMLFTYDKETGGRNSTGLAEKAKAHGLLVHLYTLRDEPRFLEYGGFASVTEEADYLISLGAEGGFADFPGTIVRHLTSLDLDSARSGSADKDTGTDKDKDKDVHDHPRGAFSSRMLDVRAGHGLKGGKWLSKREEARQRLLKEIRASGRVKGLGGEEDKDEL